MSSVGNFVFLKEGLFLKKGGGGSRLAISGGAAQQHAASQLEEGRRSSVELGDEDNDDAWRGVGATRAEAGLTA